MSKLSKFLKVGDILVESTDKPRVVLSLTPYDYKGREFFYVEAQELFGSTTHRFGIAQTNSISCLDPDEAARLYEIHEKGGPNSPAVKMAKLREEPKKPEIVTEGRRLLTINVQDIRVDDVVADMEETLIGEVTEVVTGSKYLGHIFRYRSYADNELYQEHRPLGTEINVYREIR